MAKKDYYKVLNVVPMDSVDEIKKSYRELSKKYHPDLNPDLKGYADEKMKELTEAYEVLADKEKRKKYDGQPCFRPRKWPGGSFDYSLALENKKKKKPFMEKLLNFCKKEAGAKQETNEDKANMHFNLGLSMVENPSFYTRALEEFETAVKHKTDFMEAYYNMGIMNYRMGRFNEAINAFQKALAVNTQYPDAIAMISLLSEE